MPHAYRPAPQAFSLLEVVAVITILGIICAIVLPRMSDESSSAKEKVQQHHKATINAAIRRFHEDHGRWPADDLSDIGADRTYFPTGLPADPMSNHPYRLDPETHHVE